MFTEELAALASMSNRYGADPDYVLAGGGNTSFKSGDRLWIKGSGTALATIKPADFVVLDRQALAKMWAAEYPADEGQREAAVLQDMMNARIRGETRRPSVETLLHDLFPQKFILHVHPALVNGLTCANGGEAAAQRLFPDAVWVCACKPGYILARLCREKMEAYRQRTGKDCELLFLQNHGIFFAGQTTGQVDALVKKVMDTLRGAVRRQPRMEPADYDARRVGEMSAVLGALYGGDAAVEFASCPEVLSYDPTTKSLSPDHIVYAKAKQLSLPADADNDAVKVAFESFVRENGYKPKIVFVQNLGMFACGTTAAEAATAQAVMLDAIKVTAFAASFGGVSPMPDDLIDFIVNWEVERYRSKVSLGGGA